MIVLKEVITQELNNLNEQQLQQVADFLAFLRYKNRVASLKIDERQMAALYQEFGEEDRKLAEEGIDEYAKSLHQEDLR
ncbi:hypothetical protein NIES4071_81030 [Calothrix sp. NIES-4071]|uniref:DUF2281 domain-containing protein n=1 Tax=Dulcicalothrix desertica PCC 7102 TaxID=232991 RepID=A0A3S1C6U6_9CYAN|nr:hypothetical protein [Dulcicalothrix desertica]RUT01352.1 hypothetical protein DSM106972_069030 [Dulcicalothrix desertica PCC 7102]TWH40501.1 hypothetical protein CAL7102_09839 [Dulcicalothrix desertica PCC 7102]BAZ16228.1 hypothetical protein NIES4071_81030 [Calothrix sp. NIES-4071]BAZ62373.1 hypothetical protein NIES4105_80960 [Calothrix sp. NIES-4105]